MSESDWEAGRKYLRLAREARRFIDAPTTTPTERTNFLEVERQWLWLAQKHSLQGAQPSKEELTATMMVG
jgi:hypothetical protein